MQPRRPPRKQPCRPRRDRPRRPRLQPRGQRHPPRRRLPPPDPVGRRRRAVPCRTVPVLRRARPAHGLPWPRRRARDRVVRFRRGRRSLRHLHSAPAPASFSRRPGRRASPPRRVPAEPAPDRRHLGLARRRAAMCGARCSRRRPASPVRPTSDREALAERPVLPTLPALLRIARVVPAVRARAAIAPVLRRRFRDVRVRVARRPADLVAARGGPAVARAARARRTGRSVSACRRPRRPRCHRPIRAPSRRSPSPRASPSRSCRRSSAASRRTSSAS